MIKGTLILRRGREKPVLNHHPWLFSGAVQRIEGDPMPSDVVQIVTGDGRFLALALFNPHSQIQARILTWHDEAIDSSFWRTKLERALNHRALLNLEPATTAYRLINAEADGLPGLVVDKYGDFLVMQCLAFGIDSRKEMLAHLLADFLQPAGIIERSDVDVRQKEGLPQVSRLLWGEAPPAETIIRENGYHFGVDLLAGHKTGFYLDQRQNRPAVCRPSYVAHKTILNAFAYTGGFAIYAAAQEAAAITNIDSAIPALEQAERNMALNGFQRSQDEYIAGDVFEVLRYYREEDQQFDMVILDPPKFAHSQRNLQRASRGYKDLNMQALHLIRPGGLLATFSCSGLVSADLFQKILFAAAIDAHRDVQIIQPLGQPADHPILLTFPESAYLKGLLCRVW